MTVFVAHSGFVRYHEFMGARGYAKIDARRGSRRSQPQPAVLIAAIGHLESANRWGLLRSPVQERRAATLHVWTAELLGNSGQFGPAAEHLRAALQFEPDSAPAHYNLGVLLSMLGDTDEAIEHYRLAAQLDPTDADVQNNLGYLLALRDDPEAITHLRNAARLDPRYAANLDIHPTEKTAPHESE
jgi:tetratricopeptide (TPR) repeat protein